MNLSRFVSSPDAREAALSFILAGNLNKVVWDDCQFIWDSRGLFDNGFNDEASHHPFLLNVVVSSSDYKNNVGRGFRS